MYSEMEKWNGIHYATCSGSPVCSSSSDFILKQEKTSSMIFDGHVA